MYYLSPFRYLLEGLLGAAVHNRPVVCASDEFARFPPPPGQTCQSYTRDFIARSGGYVQNGANGLCEFCQFATGDEYAKGFNVFYNRKWTDFGVMLAFCAFNFSVVFFFSWLVLGGFKKVRKGLGSRSKH